MGLFPEPKRTEMQDLTISKTTRLTTKSPSDFVLKVTFYEDFDQDQGF